MVKHEDAPFGSRTAPVGSPPGGGPHSSPVAWLAVTLVVVGFAVGTVALIAHNSLVLWIIGVVILLIGGTLMITSKVMDQAH